ncbi:hypothetical protein ACFWN5_23475 [Streptomyces sp. NPDC058430]|uniref:hypothetical protein n=1 Tax=Streptomyces sp. NPDC058430 TaxID=3346495 RepID=UPI0036586B80
MPAVWGPRQERLPYPWQEDRDEAPRAPRFVLNAALDEELEVPVPVKPRPQVDTGLAALPAHRTGAPIRIG